MFLREGARAEGMWEGEAEIGESLEPGAEKSNTREGHHVIIAAKQPAIQEAKDIPRGSRT